MRPVPCIKVDAAHLPDRLEGEKREGTASGCGGLFGRNGIPLFATLAARVFQPCCKASEATAHVSEAGCSLEQTDYPRLARGAFSKCLIWRRHRGSGFSLEGCGPPNPSKKSVRRQRGSFRKKAAPLAGGLRDACRMQHASLLFHKKGGRISPAPQGMVLNYCAAASSMASSTVRSMYSPSGMEVWSS